MTGSTERTSSESRLIGISKQYHKAFAAKDVDALQNLFAENVTLYADEVAIAKDIVGRKDVVGYYQDFFDNYDFERTESTGAVNEQDSVALSIVTDKATTPKKGKSQPSNVISLTKLKVTALGKVLGIWLARQLRFDEAEAKFKKVPDYHSSSFNPDTIPVPSQQKITPGEGAAKSHEEIASQWSNIFINNDVAKAGEICESNVKVHNLLVSQETNGLQAYKDQLKDIFKDWECKGHESVIAVTPGNKGFVWWKSTGTFKDETFTVWGITFLLYSGVGKVSEAAIIHQPFPSMRQALIK